MECTAGWVGDGWVSGGREQEKENRRLLLAGSSNRIGRALQVVHWLDWIVLVLVLLVVVVNQQRFNT